jgi:hypothetical protein
MLLLAKASHLSNIYTRAHILLTDSSTPWAQDLHTLSSLSDAFLTAYSRDRASTRFANAHVRKYRGDVLTASARAQRKWREELWRDLVEWVLPRVLRMLKSVPMPWVEYTDANLDLALDSLML